MKYFHKYCVVRVKIHQIAPTVTDLLNLSLNCVNTTGVGSAQSLLNLTISQKVEHDLLTEKFCGRRCQRNCNCKLCLSIMSAF